MVTLTEALVARGIGGIKIKFHPDFDWNMVKYPVNIYRDRKGYFSTDFEPRRDVASVKSVFDGVGAGTTGVYYADIARADDAGNGLTMATAKKTIAACLRMAEADSTKTAALVYVKAGWYPAKWGLMTNGSGGTAIPTQPFALVAIGGTASITAAIETSSWALDSGDTTNRTYNWTRANTRWLLDRVNLDGKGLPTKIPRVASVAAVRAATGNAYYIDGSNVVTLRRGDGLVPDVNNTALILNADVFRSNISGVHMYASGVDFIGGQTGTLQVNSTIGASIDVVAEDCGFFCPGHDYENPAATAANLISYDAQGICVLNRPRGARSPSDNVNIHGFNVTSTASRAHCLVINGRGWDVGAMNVASCNHLTTHGNDVVDVGAGIMEYGARLIALNFDGEASSGGMVGFSGGQIALFGGVLDGDRGSQGVGVSQGIGLGNSAKLFAYETIVRRCEVGLGVEGNAQAFVRSLQLSGGRVAIAGGVVSNI